MVDITFKDYGFGPEVGKTNSVTYPNGTKVTTHSRFKPENGLVGYNKIVELSPVSPLRESGVKGFVYGTFVDKFVKDKDGKPLSSKFIYVSSPDREKQPIKKRSELLMIGEKDQLLARGKEQIKNLIRTIQENGLKVVKR